MEPSRSITAVSQRVSWCRVGNVMVTAKKFIVIVPIATEAENFMGGTGMKNVLVVMGLAGPRMIAVIAMALD